MNNLDINYLGVDSFVIVKDDPNNRVDNNVSSNNGSPRPTLLVQTIMDFLSGKKSILSSRANSPKSPSTGADDIKPVSNLIILITLSLIVIKMLPGGYS